jgi:hypothetical protein
VAGVSSVVGGSGCHSGGGTVRTLFWLLYHPAALRSFVAWRFLGAVIVDVGVLGVGGLCKEIGSKDKWRALLTSD